MDIKTGMIVTSLSGRDKDQLFIVIDIMDNGYLLIVDGKGRKLEKPKKKNIKHVKFYTSINNLTKSIFEDKPLTNALIRKILNNVHEQTLDNIMRREQ